MNGTRQSEGISKGGAVVCKHCGQKVDLSKEGNHCVDGSAAHLRVVYSCQGFSGFVSQHPFWTGVIGSSIGWDIWELVALLLKQ